MPMQVRQKDKVQTGGFSSQTDAKTQDQARTWTKWRHTTVESKFIPKQEIVGFHIFGEIQEEIKGHMRSQEFHITIIIMQASVG